jgi:hypothetical protein
VPALAMLLPMTSSACDELFRPLKPCWKDIFYLLP